MSSQNRVDPFEIRPESGLGGRWPMRCRPGSSVEGVPGFGHQASGCTRFGPLLMYIYIMLRFHGPFDNTSYSFFVLFSFFKNMRFTRSVIL